MKGWRPTAAESRTRLGWLARQACARLGYRLAVDVPARHELMWRLFADGNGYAAIGQMLGRDHSTVIAGVARHCERAGLPLPGGGYA